MKWHDWHASGSSAISFPENRIEFRQNQPLHFRPDVRISIHLRVCRAEPSLIPGIPAEVDLLAAVIELAVEQDLGARPIPRHDSRPPSDRESVALKEIRRGANVRWNRIVSATNAVHLDRQKYRHSQRLQFLRKFHYS